MTDIKCPCGGKAEHVVHGDYYSHKVRCKKCNLATRGTAFKNDIFNKAEFENHPLVKMGWELAKAKELLFRAAQTLGKKTFPDTPDADLLDEIDLFLESDDD